MIAILQAKLKVLFHRPWDFIITTIASFLFAFVFSQVIGHQSTTAFHIPLIAMDESVKESSLAESLIHSELHHFYWETEEQLEDDLIKGRVEFGVALYEDKFLILEGMTSTNIYIAEQYIKNAYIKDEQNKRLEALVRNQFPQAEADQKLYDIKNASLYTVKENSFKQTEDRSIDNTYQALFGITLFFVIYTIAYRVLNIFVEKQAGIWDRMILSPLSKSQMYIGNFLYSFLTGYAQLAIILFVFRFIIGINFNGKFLLTLLLIAPYVFAILSMSLFIVSLVKSIQQFNAAMPIVAISMAMIGGALWPLEIVESKVMLTLSKFMPIKYGIDLLNGIAVYDLTFDQLLMPISILLLMGVFMMGLGIHFMERRHV